MLKTKQIFNRLKRLKVEKFPIDFRSSSIAISLKDDRRGAGLFERYFGVESGVCDPARLPNRWKMFVPAFAVHGCIGASYGWSHISAALMREQGFVSSSAGDWSLDLVTYPMTILIGGIGFSAAILGRWVAKVGPRRAMFQGSLNFGAGYGLATYAICSHNIYLLYPGVALIGFGTGSLYTPPVQMLIDWFPDRKGLASGIVVSGTGSGVLFFAPMMDLLIKQFTRLPEYLGTSLQVVSEGGRLLGSVGGSMQEVVFASAQELSKLPYAGLAEGYYLVGSGSTGVGLAYGAMGAIYTSVLMASTMALKRPPPSYQQRFDNTSIQSAAAGKDVHVDLLLKTPQFYLLFATSVLLSTGGMALMSVAKPMISEIFSAQLPGLVTASFATAYLMAMSTGNLFGRVGWAALSDRVGRGNTFTMFSVCGVGVYAALPSLISYIACNPDSHLAPVVLGMFCLNTVLAISILGGVWSVLPAYEADLYGRKYVGAIHTRFLPSATVASVLGPAILLNLRAKSEYQAMVELVEKIDPAAFESRFSAGVGELQNLIQTKTVTISRLMEIAPPGVVDPSPFVYNSTLYTMAGLVSLAACLHFMVRPIDNKYTRLIK